MTLSSLPVGRRFALPSLGLTGKLLRLGECGAVVRYDGTEVREFTDGRTGEHVTFRGPAREPMVISLRTEIVAL